MIVTGHEKGRRGKMCRRATSVLDTIFCAVGAKIRASFSPKKMSEKVVIVISESQNTVFSTSSFFVSAFSKCLVVFFLVFFFDVSLVFLCVDLFIVGFLAVLCL